MAECKSSAAAARLSPEAPRSAARTRSGQAVPVPDLVLRRHEGTGAAAGAALRAAGARGIPVLATPVESTAFIKLLSSFLEERLAKRASPALRCWSTCSGWGC